jgi:hypothetical protein
VFPVTYELNMYIVCVPYGSHSKQRLLFLNSINRLGFVMETQIQRGAMSLL